MPARSQEEKERRRLEFEERKLARKKNKEIQLKNNNNNAKNNNNKTGTNNNNKKINYKNITPYDANSHSLLIKYLTSNDTLGTIYTFLTSRELGATIVTCRYLYNALDDDCRIAHLLSRLNNNARCIKMCDNELEAKGIINKSLVVVGGSGAAADNNSKNKKKYNSSNKYVSYARFVESSVLGYEMLSNVSSEKATTIVLPEVVNGRIASVSPEHTLCRVGGNSNDKTGAGGSGVFSMGVGKRGQLGNNKRQDEKYPYVLRNSIGYNGIRIVQVSAGGGLVRVAHSLLLTSTGNVLSFGMAQYGQLGHGYSSGKQLSDVLYPKYIDALKHLTCTCISAGEMHSAVVTDDGDIYSWGDGFCGQLGLGNKRPQLLPKQVTLGGLDDECVSSLSCGARHTLVVTDDGEVFTFGLGHFGVLGRSYTPFEYDSDVVPVEDLITDADAPPLPPPQTDNNNNVTTTIDAETQEQLSLIANVTLDDNSDQCYPKIIDSLQGVAHVIGCSAGHRHSMLLDNHGVLYTFGSGLSGALGHGNHMKQEYPLQVSEFCNNNIYIKQMSAGVDISMAVSTNGHVYAWGKADNGRIGLGAKSNNISIPRKVYLPEEKVVDVECGYVHSLIITLSGTAYMCGGVGVDGADDGIQNDNDTNNIEYNKNDGYPMPLQNINIWHSRPEPKDIIQSEKWKKYGKYEVKGRRQMMSNAERWN